MYQLLDCPSCACLFDAADASCPFCGARPPRSVGAPPWLAVGFALGLGAASCAPKAQPGDESTSNDTSVTMSSSSDSVSGWTHTGDVTTYDPCYPDVPTYAGIDESSVIGDCDPYGTTGQDTTITDTSSGSTTSTTSTSSTDSSSTSSTDSSSTVGEDTDSSSSGSDTTGADDTTG